MWWNEGFFDESLEMPIVNSMGSYVKPMLLSPLTRHSDHTPKIEGDQFGLNPAKIWDDGHLFSKHSPMPVGLFVGSSEFLLLKIDGLDNLMQVLFLSEGVPETEKSER
ncbi:predicted protein [Sclerotinia sclerotiorum 1980 UF-70]|uniref:Uncharacterized protein n=1 Tax=Sclerotinia sclerotiorum (strain ATCC 18683 / 1980 / Ss-1) TaxID=665079 RepID=A7F0W8_SCLS1|nr:predicted protein [Sclerotinia sclerotiorum 1980 UF-70]EDN95360.1 predicted protein [Sclerotinia sclerotiorum 1980 UF-70]